VIGNSERRPRGRSPKPDQNASDQAASQTEERRFFFPRYENTPSPATPINIIVHGDGCGVVMEREPTGCSR
jgi:hypothetical protein